MLKGERVFSVSYTISNQASRSKKETNRDIKFLSRKIRTLKNCCFQLFQRRPSIFLKIKMYCFKEHSSHRINNPQVSLSKYLTSSVTRANREPILISSNKVKPLKLNTEPIPEQWYWSHWRHLLAAPKHSNPLGESSQKQCPEGLFSLGVRISQKEQQ